MRVFRSIFFVAVMAGGLSGALTTVLHHISTVPIILHAEVYEKAADDAKEQSAPSSAAPHDLEQHVPEQHAQEQHAPWEPAEGIERTAYTALADVLTGIGFALLLVSGYALRGESVDWRRGLFWGMAGFATFTLAPDLGLPLEVPGAEAAPLLGRQIWWWATVLLTGGGLALLTFKRQAIWAALAIAMIILPHLLGAPQPVERVSAAPEALTRQFIVAATVTNFVFWMSLGASSGFLYRRFRQSA